MKDGLAELDERIFEMMKKNVTGLVVTLFIFTGSQTAVYGLSSELRDLAAGC